MRRRFTKAAGGQEVRRDNIDEGKEYFRRRLRFAHHPSADVGKLEAEKLGKSLLSPGNLDRAQRRANEGVAKGIWTVDDRRGERISVINDE